MKIGDLQIEVIFPSAGDPLFITGVWGHCSIGLLEDVATQLEESFDGNMPEWQRDRLRITGWTEPETQYGSGYGDILTIPGYFDWEILSSEAIVLTEEEL